MSLALLLTLTQIAFYLSAIAVAWLTFRSAKRSFLSSVNTEYKRRIMDRLQELSEQLWDDFARNPDGFIGRVADEICKRIDIGRKTDLQASDMVHAQSVIAQAKALYQRLLTDPFVPSIIRVKILPYLDHRRFVSEMVASALIRKAADWSEPTRDVRVLREGVIKALGAQKYTVQSDLRKIMQFRFAIQKYLESFDPLERHTLRR